MSAYLELQRDGRLGQQGALLLYDAAAAAAHIGRFRPADGPSWTDDAVHGLAADVLTTGGRKLVTSLLIRATDDASLRRLMVRAVTNHLRDRDRREGRGPLVRALSDAANDDGNELSTVETPAGRAWTVPDVSGDVWTGDQAELVRAAFEVEEVALLRWRSDTRRSPVAERRSLVAVMRHVIDIAAGPVPYTTMAEVVEHRFALLPPPMLVDLADEPGPVDTAVTPDVLTAASESATAIFDQLTDRERRALHHYEEGTTTIRELADTLGVSKSTAANVVNRLKILLAGALADDPDPGTALFALGDLIDSWTEDAGPSSGTGIPS